MHFALISRVSGSIRGKDYASRRIPSFLSLSFLLASGVRGGSFSDLHSRGKSNAGKGAREERKDAWSSFFSSSLALEILASARARVYLSQGGSRVKGRKRGKKRRRPACHARCDATLTGTPRCRSWPSSTGWAGMDDRRASLIGEIEKFRRQKNHL